MAQRSSRKRRKQRQRAHAGPAGASPEASKPGDDDEPAMARGYARGRAKDEAARAALRPLAPGERPRAVTAAGLVALLLGATNLVAYLAGTEIGGKRPAVAGIAIFSGLMLTAAWGCFRVRYWAVLGMQALLGLIILTFSLLLVRAESVAAVAIALAVIAATGTLFWHLVKSMARIQMPERPSSR